MTELHILKGPLAGRVFPLEGGVTSIGRDPGNTIELQDPSVSGEHARLLREGARFFIEDLNSQNGIIIEGRPVKPGQRTALAPGIPVALGNVVFSLGAPFSGENMVTRSAMDLTDRTSGQGHGVLTDTRIQDRTKRTESFADDLTCEDVKTHDPEDFQPLLNLEMETTADMAQLVKVREFVGKFAREHLRGGLDDQDVWNLELAVHETAANIIAHAYHDRRGQKIRIQAIGYAGRAVIRLIHWGDSFQPPEDIPPPPLDGSKENGFGLFIIHNLVDGVTYAQEGDGSHAIRLMKAKKPV